VVANYRYDPFGNTLLQSGTLADANVYRFSSKEVHTNSLMYYYGYRFYDPVLQRWLNRDPLGEPGFELIRHLSTGRGGPIPLSLGAELIPGLNLYWYVGNRPSSYTDPFGLEPGYGNPVSGPNGPIGPSNPYAPGWPYYPNGIFYQPGSSSCMENCLNNYPGLSAALGLTPLGLLNAKCPFTEYRPGAFPWTSLDKRGLHGVEWVNLGGGGQFQAL
jgi:RHS repeat-associated protein